MKKRRNDQNENKKIYLKRTNGLKLVGRGICEQEKFVSRNE
jgi:hypothetical protein